MGKAMKKQNILNLIKYHVEKNENGFRDESVAIAKYFDSIGDYQLSEYVMSLIAESNLYTTQDADTADAGVSFLSCMSLGNLPTLILPSTISRDMDGLMNAINRRSGLNKFMFGGKSGSGKTEAVKQIASMLSMRLYYVNFELVVDSKLGQTNKNIRRLFREINEVSRLTSQRSLILFDEIDAIVLDRVNNNDVREMGRATSTMLRELDKFSNNDCNSIIIATTNLVSSVDKALLRRFDAIINFDRYTKDDLIRVAERFVDDILKKYEGASRDARLLKKILAIPSSLPYPGELRNIIRTSFAFSDVSDSYDYLRRIYSQLVGNIDDMCCAQLYKQGFTIREIENLKGESRSTISRKLNNGEVKCEQCN